MVTTKHVATPLSMAAAVARMLLGFTFLWAFFDKTFGLGYTTTSSNTWIQDGSIREAVEDLTGCGGGRILRGRHKSDILGIAMCLGNRTLCRRRVRPRTASVLPAEV